MVIGLRTAVRNLSKTDTEAAKKSIGDVSDKFGIDVLLSAQGNSGTILSFLFKNLKSELKGKKDIKVEEMSKTLADIGSRAMENAMAKAQRGTLLSVLEVGTLKQQEKKPTTILQLIRYWYDESLKSLLNTPNELIVNNKKILKDANVVDSGAQGLVFFIQGMLNALSDKLVYDDYLGVSSLPDRAILDNIVNKQTNNLTNLDDVDDSDYESNSHSSHDNCQNHGVEDFANQKFKYCTEVVFEFKNRNLMEEEAKNQLESAVNDLGDSIVPVVVTIVEDQTNDERFLLGKLHIHANDPETVFKQVRKLAFNNTLIKEKSDNMREQVAMEKLSLPAVEKNRNVQLVGFDYILPSKFKREGIYKKYITGIKIVEENDTHLLEHDTMTMNAIKFTNSLRLQEPKKVGTGAPSAEVFKQKLNSILDEGIKEILILTVPRKGSRGLFNCIKTAIEGLDPEKQKRIKRMVCQESMDLLSLRGWELIADGSVNSADELAKELRSLHDSVFQTSTLRTLDGWVKWGRINELKGTLYWVLRTVIYFNMSLTTLATVLTPSDVEEINSKMTKIVMIRRRNYEEQGVRSMVDFAKKKCKEGTKYKFLMFHPSGCSHYIEDTVNALQNELPEGTIDTMYYADIGGAIAAAGHIDMIWFKFWPAKDAKGRRFKLS